MKFEILLIGTGAELVLADVPKETFRYLTENNISLEEFIYQNKRIPDEVMPFRPEDWFEAGNIVHAHNAFLSEGNLLIVKNPETQIAELPLFPESLEYAQINLDYRDIYISETEGENFWFLGQSFEKGIFFTSVIDAPEFNLQKLEIEYLDIEGIEIISKVSYAGTELRSDSADTRGTGMNFILLSNQ